MAHPLKPGETLPVYIANFILMDYGTGAIFGCPAHDQRDHDFATKYDLPIIPVVRPSDMSDEAANAAFDRKAPPIEGDGILFNSGFIDGLTVAEAKERMIRHFEAESTGTRTVNYRLRDWGISRQRYWGCPIPVIHCDDCVSCRCRTRTSRSSCRKMCHSTSPAIRSTVTPLGSNAIARNAARPLAAKPIRWTHLSIHRVFCALHGPV